MFVLRVQADVSVVAVTARILTPRRETLLRLVQQGLPNPRIADELGLSESRVKQLMAELVAACGVDAKWQLIGYANQHLPR